MTSRVSSACSWFISCGKRGCERERTERGESAQELGDTSKEMQKGNNKSVAWMMTLLSAYEGGWR